MFGVNLFRAIIGGLNTSVKREKSGLNQVNSTNLMTMMCLYIWSTLLRLSLSNQISKICARYFWFKYHLAPKVQMTNLMKTIMKSNQSK